MKTITLIPLLLSLFCSILSFAQPSEEWILKEVQAIFKESPKDFPYAELYKKGFDDIRFYELDGKNQMLVFCEPDDARTYGFFEGMPVFTLLSISAVDKGWATNFASTIDPIEELKDVTGDGNKEIVTLSGRCGQGRCRFTNSIYQIKNNALKKILEVADFNFSGVDTDVYPFHSGDTIRSESSFRMIDMDENGINEILVESEIDIYAADGPEDGWCELQFFRQNKEGVYIASNEVSRYPAAVRQFLDNFEAAVAKKDSKKLLTYFDPLFVKEQHDEMLEGRTSQFFQEFFCGGETDYGQEYVCFKLEEIEKLERIIIVGREGELSVMYFIYGKGKKVGAQLTINILNKYRTRFGFDGARG